jgi:hypothetical protein
MTIKATKKSFSEKTEKKKRTFLNPKTEPNPDRKPTFEQKIDPDPDRMPKIKPAGLYNEEQGEGLRHSGEV